VYAVSFSPNGRNVASTSLDRTVRVWLTGGNSENITVGRHDMAGSDVLWLKDDWVASSSLDRTVRVWSYPKGECMNTFELDGFALCLAVDEQHILYSGTASGQLYSLDARTSVAVAMWKGEAGINAVAIMPGPPHILVGDAKGRLSTIDTRTHRLISEIGVSDTSDSKPISGVSCSTSVVACNSYDSVLRVYDATSQTLLHSLRGHHNRNWPIRSVLFSVGSSVYVASGSASHSAYLYGPLQTEGHAPSLVQKLKGHSGNVYAIDVYRDLMATCSADATVRLWKKN